MSFHEHMTFPLYGFHEGERVHYRALSEVQVALGEGYLELEQIRYNDLYHAVIRRTQGMYVSYWGLAGHFPEVLGKEETLCDLVIKQGIDLHAYRWYPHHEVTEEDRWILDGTVKEQVNAMLALPVFEPFLVQDFA